MSGWIKCSDRLPPLAERLEAPCAVGERVIPPLNRSVEVIVFSNGGVFSTTVEWFDGEETPTSSITHWMPLPAPPTE
ncbi:hypothetical protein PS631_00093 [Pseudomonas fluorescens]|uniref:DUF551 domain-containing protein n=1 Tax=Pseudomonas fluorescens TaxID=294 RepID=A0A5E6P435_PSEFL|nr:DUF551 domain-containing protein [Pseudomonas fluorescens]VVM37242.1 hypothetical protein PS631_00093 [Pseudomonas fluorescens]